MLSRRELYQRRCVDDLIHVVEQVSLRADVRAGLALSESTVAMLLLWSLLRWERNFLIVCLEQLGIDLWALTRELDELLKCQQHATVRAGASAPCGELDHLLRQWLKRTDAEARTMGHEFLGTEHLLLALIAWADASLNPLLKHHGLDYQAVSAAVVEALRRADAAAPGAADQADAWAAVSSSAPFDRSGLSRIPAARRTAPWGVGADRPAVGVPRRFSLAILMLMVTLFAVLFSIMRMLDVHPIAFIMIFVLVLAVGFGQALLFQGRYPRAASMWVGGILVPLEVLVAMIVVAKTSETADIKEFYCLLVCSAVLGPAVGYMAGCVTAGAFFLIDQYQKRRAARATLVDEEPLEFGVPATEGETEKESS
ncbi:MAG: Clp protease N-terminal domain-containing protein [Thermoguttaceae bacterium]|jgi:hypothetical protein